MSVAARTQSCADVLPPPAPGFPSCLLGLPPDSAALVPKEVEPAPWRCVEFEIGLRRYDTQYPAVWHSSFESPVPIERALGPVIDQSIIGARPRRSIAQTMLRDR